MIDPNISEYPEYLKIELNINQLLKTLHGAINADFKRRAGFFDDEELFHLPEEVNTYKLSQKVNFCCDLAGQLYQSISNVSLPFARASYDKSKCYLAGGKDEELDTVEIAIMKDGDGDVLNRIFGVARGSLMLNSNQVHELGGLLIGAIRDSSSYSLRHKITQLQDKYEQMADSLLRVTYT